VSVAARAESRLLLGPDQPPDLERIRFASLRL